MISSSLQSRYRIEAESNYDDMYPLYRVSDTLLDRPVALKVLDNNSTLNE